MKEISEAKHILIIQAENPDADSLASALALEQIFSEQGKEVSLYCPMFIPRHLRYLTGWDRVTNDLPNSFDVSIIVDTSRMTLMERIFSVEQTPTLKSRPIVVIDHHDLETDIPYDFENLSDPNAASTGEIIYELAQENDWKLNDVAKDMIVVSIMADTLGLTTAEATPKTFRTVADLVEQGVKIHELDEARRQTMKRAAEITEYKGRLLQRIEYSINGELAEITIPWEEIEQYNPSMLVIDDMRLGENVLVAIAYKIYSDGHVTGKIRCNSPAPIANELAEVLGGGGHQYAAGFKSRDKHIDEIISIVHDKTESLLKELK
jgi:phosphoesterase RecJ-like protein